MSGIKFPYLIKDVNGKVIAGFMRKCDADVMVFGRYQIYERTFGSQGEYAPLPKGVYRKLKNAKRYAECSYKFYMIIDLFATKPMTIVYTNC